MSTNYKLQNYDINKLEETSFEVKSPSNIALIKYWGKYGDQLPSNPSISVTLNNAYTSSTYKISTSDEFKLNFKFESQVNDKFEARVLKHFNRVKEFFPFIDKLSFTIDSMNSFPHSSGIASSASSMSCFAFALCEIEKMITLEDHDKDYYLEKASYIARLGSGSASRSLYPKMSVWGKSIGNSSNEYAIGYDDFHPSFEGILDAIAIVSNEEKSVSSSAGHSLMETHPYAQTRFLNARNNFNSICIALKNGDFNSFCKIVESEALELHGLMMNSNPSYILMKPSTLAIIEEIRTFRNETGAKVCFTLDAGPNVHILYLNSDKELVENFIKDRIVNLTHNKTVIYDVMGEGPSFKLC